MLICFEKVKQIQLDTQMINYLRTEGKLSSLIINDGWLATSSQTCHSLCERQTYKKKKKKKTEILEKEKIKKKKNSKRIYKKPMSPKAFNIYYLCSLSMEY